MKPSNKDTEVNKAIGIRIKEIRKKFKLTLSFVSEQMGMSPKEIKDFENGKKDFYINDLYLFSRILGTSIEELFKNVEQKEPPAKSAKEPPARSAKEPPARSANILDAANKIDRQLNINTKNAIIDFLDCIDSINADKKS